MISDPCGLEVLVAPIVIVTATAMSDAATMDATSGGTLRFSEPKFNEWRKNRTSRVLKRPQNVSTTATHFKTHVLPPQDDAGEETASNSTWARRTPHRADFSTPAALR